MFLRRSLASLARAYKLHVKKLYDFFLCRYIWGFPPPPPHTKKLATLLLPAFAHQKSGQNEDGRFRPPHSLHEIAATDWQHYHKRVTFNPDDIYCVYYWKRTLPVNVRL